MRSSLPLADRPGSDNGDLGILKIPIKDQSSWTAETFQLQANIIQLSDRAIEAFDRPSHDNMPLRQLAAEIVDRCENGTGVTVVRGLPIGRFDPTALRLRYSAFCGLIGNIVTQNAKGETLCEVTDTNAGKMEDSNVRGYLTNQALRFHSDSSDIIGLLCKSTSASGGDSLVVSASTIYNRILADYSEYLGLFYVGFFYDSRGHQRAGEPPAYRNPIFNYCNGKLSCRFYLENYIEPGYAKLGLSLSSYEKQAIALFNSIAEDPGNYIRFRMQPGDIVFYSNNSVLHGRTSYEDGSESSEEPRKLYRIWLNPHKPRRLPLNFARYRFGYL